MASELMPLTVRRDYSLPDAREILERYGKDLKSVKDVRDEIERKLGWQAHGQTIWRHIKALQKEKQMQALPTDETAVTCKTETDMPSTLEMEVVSEGDMTDEEAVDVDGEDDLYDRIPPKLTLQMKPDRQLRRVRSKRLTKSSIVVPEKDNDCVRVYRLNARSKNGVTVYYRCSTCDTIWRKIKDSLREGEEIPADQRFLPNLKTVNGEIVGDPYPPHHPDCLPIPPEVQEAQEIDRSCRVRVREGLLAPRQAWWLGRRLAMARIFPRGSSMVDEIPFPEWKTVGRKYRELERKRQRFNEYNSKFSEDTDGIALTNEELQLAEEDTPGPSSEAESALPSSCRRPLVSSIVVPEIDGDYIRVYRFANRSRDGKTCIYRCIRCDTLCQNAQKSEFELICGSVKAVNGQLLGNRHPEHHPDCLPIAARILDAQEVENSRTLGSKKGISSRQQTWNTDGEMALEQSASGLSEEVEWKPTHKYNTFGRTRRSNLNQSVDDCEQIVYDGDSIDVGSTECVPMTSGFSEPVAKPPNCSCRQYYEANLELHQEILRCLEEMKELRDEIRIMYSESRSNLVIDETEYGQ